MISTIAWVCMAAAAITSSSTEEIDISCRSGLENAARITMRDWYTTVYTRPCEYYGFPMAASGEELVKQKSTGANCAGLAMGLEAVSQIEPSEEAFKTGIAESQNHVTQLLDNSYHAFIRADFSRWRGKTGTASVQSASDQTHQLSEMISTWRNREELAFWVIDGTNAEDLAWKRHVLQTGDENHPVLGSCDLTFHDAPPHRPSVSLSRINTVVDGFEPQLQGASPELSILEAADRLAAFGKPWAAGSTDWLSVGPAETSIAPAVWRRRMYEAVGSGWWQLSLPEQPWNTGSATAEAGINRLISELRGLGSLVHGMWPIRPKVAIWISGQTLAKSGWLPVWSHCQQALARAQIPRCFIYDDQVLNGLISDYPVVFSIDNASGGKEIEEGLAAYIKAGGHLVMAGVGSEVMPKALIDSTASSKGKLSQLGGQNQTELISRLVELASKAPGAKPVQLRTDNKLQGSIMDAIESLLLTDGVNFINLLINTGQDNVPLKIELSQEVTPYPLRRYSLFDPLTGQRLARLNLGTALDLGPGEMTVHYWRYQAEVEPVREVAQEINNFAKAHPEDPVCVRTISAIQTCLAQGALEQALAGVSRVWRRPAICARLKSDNEHAELTATLTDRKGRPVRQAHVITEWSLAPGKTTALQETAPGIYTCRWTQDNWPLAYDPDAGADLPYHGPVRISIIVRGAHGEGDTIVTGRL